VAWIDDQLAFEAEAQAWAWAGLVGKRILPIPPDPRHGISPAELRSVRSFLEHPVF
jgi:hypothetical protein